MTPRQRKPLVACPAHYGFEEFQAASAAFDMVNLAHRSAAEKSPENQKAEGGDTRRSAPPATNAAATLRAQRARPRIAARRAYARAAKGRMLAPLSRALATAAALVMYMEIDSHAAASAESPFA